MNTVRIIYLYILSFISLIMIIVGTALFANNLTSYFFPDSYVFFEESKTSNKYDDNYYNSNYYYKDIEKEKEREQERIKEEEKRKTIQKANYKKEKIKNSIVSAIVVLIGFIMYKYHWGTIKKEITE